MEDPESISAAFAILGPLGDRLIRMRKFETLVQGADGRMQKVEMLDPAAYREWEYPYRVFRALCITFGVIVPAWLGRYARKVRDYADERPYSWGIIYQADVRAR